MVKVENELQTENGPSSNGEGGQNESQSGHKNVLRLILAVALVIGLVIGVRYWLFVKSHVSTENAQITSDVVQVAPQISGMVQSVIVKDNQLVKNGELIATIDDSTFRAAVDEAKANLAVAVAQARGAGVSVNLTQSTGSAQIRQAQGGLGQARSSVESAKAGVAAARAAVSSAEANQKRSGASIAAAQAGVANARANLAAAIATVSAFQANYDNAAREADRFANLASAGADSQQKADQLATAATAAKSALESAREQVNAARAQVESRQADLEVAKDQDQASEALVEQAKAGLSGAWHGVPQARAREEQAQGQLQQASTVPTQVAVSQTGKAQAEAKVEQARSALQTAILQLSYCRICAPVDGRVSKKTVEVGEFVQPGTPLMALIPTENMWVVANFKETQLASIHVGSKANIYVDAFPRHPFEGAVDSISAGTGATFALLPPDNASGNFVKVVQKLPVKIALKPGQPHLDQLRAGISVTVVVDKR